MGDVLQTPARQREEEKDKKRLADATEYIQKHSKEKYAGLPAPMPANLPPRIIDALEMERIKRACLERLQGFRGVREALKVVEELVRFCELLSEPENHVLISTGRFIEKPVNMGAVHDMRNEMAQELISLAPFTAYISVVQINEDGQTLVKGKIRTIELSMLQMKEVIAERTEKIARNSLMHCKPRDEIEQEIRQRQKRWLAGGGDERRPVRLADRKAGAIEVAPPPTRFRTPTQ